MNVLLRLGGLVAAFTLAASAYPQAQTASLTLTGSATVTSLAGVSRSIDAPASLSDRDTIATALGQTASIASSTGWSAALTQDTRATVRTEAVLGGPAPVFARVLEILNGSLTWKVEKGAAGFLRTPAGILSAQSATKVTVSFADGVLTIHTEEGTVELTGNTADVKLKAGQWIRVSFSPRSNTFFFEILEDGGNAVDIEIGKTLIHANKGDAFEIAIQAGHADVRVTKGLIQVSGPDKRMVEVGPGQTETVVNGGEGAVRGEGPRIIQVQFNIPGAPLIKVHVDTSDIFRTDVSPS